MSRLPHAERGRALSRLVWLAPAAALAFVGCQDDRLPSEPEPDTPFSASAQAGGVGADDWIVVFRDDVTDPPGLARRLVSANGGSIRHIYSHALRGFAGTLPPGAIEAIGHNPNVAYVERDGLMRKTEVGSWGLDRIDQRDLPLSGTYDPGEGRDGSGVFAYIIDTGVDLSVSEFGGRASSGYDFVDDDGNASDCDGHGTHVAGTVGSQTYGVAKNVALVAVRVLNCQGSGSYSDVIAGINWVTANKADRAVANMSLGGGYSQAVNDAVYNSVAAGVTFAVSAGNSNANACNYSPASAPDAITVGSTTSSDARSSFSNYGTCVDIFAPGSSITSTTKGGGTASWSGTSMASPHVAGVAALYLQDRTAAADVWPAMAGRATRDVISNPGSGSPNRLLYSGTDSFDPCAGGCGSAIVQWISPVTMKSNRNRRASGTVAVEITDANGPLPGVTISGNWTVTGAINTSSTGVTGSDGRVTLSSGNIRNATDFSFCVTGLSKSGYEDRSNGECDGDGTPWGGEPQSGDPPSNLQRTTSQKGKNIRANLTWVGGDATVDVWRNGTIRATVTNTESYTDNIGKNPPSYVYKVCNSGSTACTLEVPETP